MSKIGIIFKTGGHIAPEDYGISQIIILDEADLPEYESIMAVSYTHLTLPTKRIV